MYSSLSRRMSLSRSLLMGLIAVLLAGSALVAFPQTSAAAPEPAPSADGYVVKAGDTLNAIAARYGVSTSALARANGLDSVTDRCVKIEHARLFGGLNWVGVNTGVISAKRPRQLAY